MGRSILERNRSISFRSDPNASQKLTEETKGAADLKTV
jgi:hypothetical protein